VLHGLFRAWEARGIELISEQRRQADRLAVMMGNMGRVGAVLARDGNAKAIQFILGFVRGPGRDARGTPQGAQTVQWRPTGLLGGGRRFAMVRVEFRASHGIDRIRTGYFGRRNR